MPDSEQNEMTQCDLNTIIQLHEKWLNGEPEGKKDDLSNTNLHGANLHGADLHGADLHGAILSGANLNDADLHGAIPVSYTHLDVYKRQSLLCLQNIPDTRNADFHTYTSDLRADQISSGCFYFLNIP